MDIKICPSILSADFGNLNKEMLDLEEHVEFFHVDVMDGHFVPNITIGAPVVRKLLTKRPMNVHLMIENPENYIEDFIKAGGDRIVIHVEACGDKTRDCLLKIKELGAECGVSIKPGTPVSAIEDVLDVVDEVLVMTVEPGFGGQKFMNDMVPKIRELREKGFDKDIAVDGGINAETAKIVREAGANVLIAGSYIYKAEDRVAAIESLKG